MRLNLRTRSLHFRVSISKTMLMETLIYSRVWIGTSKLLIRTFLMDHIMQKTARMLLLLEEGTKTKIHKSSKKSEAKKSRSNLELLSRSTWIELQLKRESKTVNMLKVWEDKMINNSNLMLRWDKVLPIQLLEHLIVTLNFYLQTMMMMKLFMLHNH